MVSTISISEKGLRRVFILPLLLALTITGLSSSQSCAEDGLVYPDSAQVFFSRTVQHDTVTVLIQNLSADSVVNLFLSEFTDSVVVDLECLVDGVPIPDSVINHGFGDVYPGKHTTRWLIGAFAQTALFKYYSPLYTSCETSWSAGHPYAIFGIMPLVSGIGPPRNVSWGQ